MYKSDYFNLGSVTLSSGIVLEKLANKRFAKSVDSAIRRFYNKDWGKVTKDRKRQNEEILKHYEDPYILGIYKTCKGDIWIITNRATENLGENVTNVLFPDEY